MIAIGMHVMARYKIENITQPMIVALKIFDWLWGAIVVIPAVLILSAVLLIQGIIKCLIQLVTNFLPHYCSAVSSSFTTFSAPALIVSPA